MAAPRDYTRDRRAALREAMGCVKTPEALAILKDLYERADMEKHHCAGFGCWKVVVQIREKPEEWAHLCNVNIVEAEDTYPHVPEPVRE